MRKYGVSMVSYVNCDGEGACVDDFHQLFDPTPWAVSITDLIEIGEPIVYVNPAFTRLTGYRYEVAVGQNCRLLQGNDLSQIGARLLDTALAEQRAELIEILSFRQDGTHFWNLLRVMPIRTEYAEARYMMMLHQDISHLMDAHDALLKMLESERAQKDQQLHAERLKSMGTMAASVAHEINNPVAGVLMNLEYAVDVYTDCPELMDIMKESIGELRRVGKLVQSLLGFSRKEQDKQSYAFDLIAIVIMPLNGLFHSLLIANNVNLVNELPAKIPLVYANADAVQQILMNLLSNAIYALRDKEQDRRIWITAEIEQSFVVISVRDNGGGIPEALQSKIFEAFMTTKPKGEGTGMGLSLSVALAVEFGGDLMLDKDYTAGAKFDLYIPTDRSLDGGGLRS